MDKSCRFSWDHEVELRQQQQPANSKKKVYKNFYHTSSTRRETIEKEFSDVNVDDAL